MKKEKNKDLFKIYSPIRTDIKKSKELFNTSLRLKDLKINTKKSNIGNKSKVETDLELKEISNLEINIGIISLELNNHLKNEINILKEENIKLNKMLSLQKKINNLNTIKAKTIKTPKMTKIIKFKQLTIDNLNIKRKKYRSDFRSSSVNNNLKSNTSSKILSCKNFMSTVNSTKSRSIYLKNNLILFSSEKELLNQETKTKKEKNIRSNSTKDITLEKYLPRNINRISQIKNSKSLFQSEKQSKLFRNLFSLKTIKTVKTVKSQKDSFYYDKSQINKIISFLRYKISKTQKEEKEIISKRNSLIQSYGLTKSLIRNLKDDINTLYTDNIDLVKGGVINRKRISNYSDVYFIMLKKNKEKLDSIYHNYFENKNKHNFYFETCLLKAIDPSYTQPIINTEFISFHKSK